MWISQKVGALEQPSAQIQVGEVLSNTGSLSIQAVGQYSAVPLAAPFGITYVPPKGTKVVLLEEEDTVLCTGAISESVNLSEGELMLRSSGGAYIYLKNNGDISLSDLKKVTSNIKVSTSYGDLQFALRDENYELIAAAIML